MCVGTLDFDVDLVRKLGFTELGYPEVKAKSFDFKFPGRGQRNTPVLCVRGAIELILVLPGHHAAHVRRRASELLVRYLGGPPQANLARRF